MKPKIRRAHSKKNLDINLQVHASRPAPFRLTATQPTGEK